MSRLPILLAFCCSLLAQPKQVAIEQLISAAFPSQMTAAPSGGHVAWVQNAQGIRNIWVASPPEYVARMVTAYKADDGKDILSLAWAQDGLVYEKGGIFSVPLAGGEPTKVGDGTDPAVSLKDGRIAYLRDGQVWSGTERLFEIRGKAGQLRWSPDGSQLAFVSNRVDHSFIAVFDTGSKMVRILDPSLDRDSDPVWSPDGKQIAYLRQPAVKDNDSFHPRRIGEPWSIRLADVATGQGKAVFQADPGRGSVFREIVSPNQILWASTGQLTFPWERDGWTHLYSLPVVGQSSAKLLTFGEFEVEDVALTPDGKEVLYSSNSDDSERRHLFRVAAAGGPVSPLTSGKGIEWSPVMTSDSKALAFFRSDSKMPARAALMAAFGPPRDLVPLEFPADSLVEPQPVIFSAADGMKIRGQLFLPANGNATERKPAMIFFHGGSRRQMLLGWHYREYYHNTYAFNQWLASRGYVVLSVNYRSGIGYGMEFREALNFGAAGASEFNDVLGAGLYLQSRPEVDAKRIGLWGGSYGGYLTALGLARASDLFAAGVDIHGVHDWNVVIKNFHPSYNPLERPDAAKLAFDSSPMAAAARWKSPVLIVHGDDDKNVPFSESVTLVEALRKQGVEIEQLVFPDEVHQFSRHARWVELFKTAGDFIDRRVKGRK